MRQQRLHKYFPLTCNPKNSPPKLSFLDIPCDIRHRIYVLAGLVRVCPIDLNFEGENKSDHLLEFEKWRQNSIRYRHRSEQKGALDFNSFATPRCFYRKNRFLNTVSGGVEHIGLDCICGPIPYRLLYISRAIHKEVSSILYSENKFRICRSNPGGLVPLEKLGSNAVASLTSLSIRLNSCSCTAGHDCPPIPPEAHDIWYLCHWTPGSTCHWTCKRGRDKPLGKIHSRDSKNLVSEWSRICARFAAHGRPGLQLSVICDTNIFQTAQEIVKPLLLTSLKECALRLGQNPNSDLRDLARTTVLQVTDRSGAATFRFTDLPGEIQDVVLANTDLVAPHDLEWNLHSGLLPTVCCKTCTDALEVCCCSTRHAAYTSTCTCWTMPLAIFQVSRRINKAATRIFYSQNRFILLPQKSKYPWDIPPHEPIERCRFLSRLPRAALKHLRSLEWDFFQFSPNDYLYYTYNTAEYQHWRNTIAFIAQELDLRRLTLTLDMSAYAIYYDTTFTGARTDDPKWTMYTRFVDPLVELRGLKDLFIHLSFPLAHRGVEQRLERDIWARALEKRVMGDLYDSSYRGKPGAWDSICQTDHLNCVPVCKVGGDVRFRDQRVVFGPDGTQVWPPGGRWQII